MININFQISYPLVNGILRTAFDEKLFQNKLTFIREFYNYNNIINKITKLTGMNFSEDKDIWLINEIYPTISNPNLLNISNKNDKIIFDLIYILVHNVFYDNNYYDQFLNDCGINENKLEAMVYLVVKKILEEIFTKNQLSKLLNELQSDMFNKCVWDDVYLFEQKINFQTSLIKQNIKNLIN